MSIAVILPGWGDEPRNGRSMEPPSQKRGSSKARTGDSLGTYQELIIREVEELVLRRLRVVGSLRVHPVTLLPEVTHPNLEPLCVDDQIDT